MHFEAESLFGLFLLIFGSYVIFQVVTKGFKGALFGGRISKSYGEVKLAKKGMMSTGLGVHGITTDDGSRIGIEIVHKSPFGFQMTPVTLTKTEAQELAQLLLTAAGGI